MEQLEVAGVKFQKQIVDPRVIAPLGYAVDPKAHVIRLAFAEDPEYMKRVESLAVETAAAVISENESAACQSSSVSLLPSRQMSHRAKLYRHLLADDRVGL